MEDKHTAPTPFNNPDVQHLVHETNRLTGTAIRYIDSVKLEPFKINDSRIFVAIEYIKSIRTAVDGYYKAIKDNFDQNASLTSELKELKEENEHLKQFEKKYQGLVSICGDKEHEAKQTADRFADTCMRLAKELTAKDEEITRLKGTLGVEAVRQNLELKEENKMMIDVLRNNHEFVLRLYTRLSSLIDESGLQDIRTELANMQSAISKHQPIKKDEN